MGTDWSRSEVEATVADYLSMLQSELSGQPYNKAERRRQLLPLLNGRSPQSVEFKRANISAALIDLGFPYIRGYKPRSNYQQLLQEVVTEQLRANGDLALLAMRNVEIEVPTPHVPDILSRLTDPPQHRHRVSEPGSSYSPPGINYLELEAKNRALGLAGEEFVIAFEQARLVKAHRSSLAARIEHVSRVRGDSEGYDILSFDVSGAERLIEVKTTKHGRETPFFVSRNEVRVSEARSHGYHLYRLFEFQSNPRLFVVHGSLSGSCVLDPISFMARIA